MTKEELKNITLPRHIGIIMDGNGRWAKQRGFGRSEGHKAGAEVFANRLIAYRKMFTEVR